MPSDWISNLCTGDLRVQVPRRCWRALKDEKQASVRCQILRR